MGQTQSAEALHAVNQVGQQTPPKEGGGIKLYKYIQAGTNGNWELQSSNARPRFYDANEDAGTSKKKDYFLEIEAGEIEVHVDQELNYVVSLAERRVNFSANDAVWALRFPTENEYRNFAEELNDVIFYNTYGVANDEASRAKQFEDFSGMFFSKNTENAAEPMDTDIQKDTEPTPDKFRERQNKEIDEDQEEINTGLIVGAGVNNYLMRGTHFDVLRNVEGSGVSDPNVSFQLTPGKGKPFTPSRVMLSNAERRMNLLTPENKNIMHHADIEVNKIVSTWTFQKDNVEIPIMDISHETKEGQLEERSTFLGLDKNRLCKWDLRDRRGVVMESPVVDYQGGKDYARNTNFSCMATSGDGYVAVGSVDGKIRLYSSKTLTRANTSIPGLGAPITAIDVTFDGKWVLATTDHYLMVVKTVFSTDKGEVTNGFTSRMGGRGATPRLLRLRPEDMIRTSRKPLTKGKFTWVTEQGQTEGWMVANCGKFNVLWNFNKVKSSSSDNLSFGGLPTSMDYIMTAKDEEVVDAAFLHSRYSAAKASAGPESAALMVATPHRLFTIGAD